MKVICKDSKTFGNVSENCEYDVVEEKEGYRIISDFIYPKECFEKVKENKKQQYKTLEALNLKNGEIYRSKERTIIREGVNIIIKDNHKSKSIILSLSDKFIKVEQPKLVTFEEAKKEYRNNKKTIESCVSGRIFKNGIDIEIGFSEIEGQWIIREEI